MADQIPADELARWVDEIAQHGDVVLRELARECGYDQMPVWACSHTGAHVTLLEADIELKAARRAAQDGNGAKIQWGGPGEYAFAFSGMCRDRHEVIGVEGGLGEDWKCPACALKTARQRIAELLALNADLERSELATRTILNEEWGRKVAELEVEQVTLQFAAGQHVTDLEQRIYALTAAVWELGRCGACEDSCGRRDKSNVTAGPCEYCSGTGYHPTAQKVLGIEREGT